MQIKKKTNYLSALLSYLLILLYLLNFTVSANELTVFGKLSTVSEEVYNINIDTSNIDVDISKIIDCLINVVDDVYSKPTRSVMQIIDMELNLWHEYEQEDGSFYIITEKPSKRYLSRLDAIKLYSESSKWKTQSFKMNSRENLSSIELDKDFKFDVKTANLENRTDIIEKNEENNKLVKKGFKKVDKENVIKSWGINNASSDIKEDENHNSKLQKMSTLDSNDDRVQVSNTATKPYNTIGFLSTKYGDDYYRGTGCLIGPYVVLTAAHVIYDSRKSYSGFPDSVVFVPGYSPETSMQEPYGYSFSDDIFVPNGYIDNEYTQYSFVPYDFAWVILDDSFDGITTFMPIGYNYQPSRINVVGYPAEVRGNYTEAMFKSIGRALEYYADNVISHTAYTTGGNSGSPITSVSSGNPYKIVGVQSVGASAAGYPSAGPTFGRYDIDNFREILSMLPPKATNVRISGSNSVGSRISVDYTYSDVNGDNKYGEEYKWYKSKSPNGSYE